MTIDYEMDRLYWVDDYRGSIHYMDFDGSGKSLLSRDVSEYHEHAYGIALSKVI